VNSTRRPLALAGVAAAAVLEEMSRGVRCFRLERMALPKPGVADLLFVGGKCWDDAALAPS